MDKMKAYVRGGPPTTRQRGPSNAAAILMVIGIGTGLFVLLALFVIITAPPDSERAATIVALGKTDPVEQSRKLASATDSVLREITKLDPQLAKHEKERRDKAKKVRAAEQAKSSVEQEEATHDDNSSEPGIVELSKFAVASKLQITSNLRDPDSASYRNVKVYRHPRSDGGYVFCGEVNGKNAFGGMAGYERFVASPVAAAIESMGPAQFQVGWDQMCDSSRFVESADWF